MLTTNSPNDPLFWLHHAFVDKIWASFQERGPKFLNSYPNPTEKLLNSNLTVADVLDTRNKELCYIYSAVPKPKNRQRLIKRQNGIARNPQTTVEVVRDERIPRTACDPFDRKSKTCTRYTKKVPENWLEKMKYPVEKFRTNERFVNMIADAATAAGISPIHLENEELTDIPHANIASTVSNSEFDDLGFPLEAFENDKFIDILQKARKD